MTSRRGRLHRDNKAGQPPLKPLTAEELAGGAPRHRRLLSIKQTNRLSNKSPTGRHARTVGTPTGKLSAESVRAALRRGARFSAQFCPPGGSRAKRVQWTKQRRRGWRSAPVFASAHRGAPRKSAKRKRARGKEFLPRVCGQKWVPPGAWRFCDTLQNGSLFRGYGRGSRFIFSGTRAPYFM